MSRNLFYLTAAAKTDSFHSKIERVGAGLDYNLYYHEGGDAEKILQAQREKSKGKDKIDVHSIAEAPLFVDRVHGDFSFKPGSPALELGIEPLPLETVGKMGTTRDSFLTRFASGMPFDVQDQEEKSAH